MDADPTPPSVAAPRRRLALPSQRALQVVLGLFWILDGALQFQPYMFSRSFVSDVILGGASGQPPFIAAFITHMGHFLSPDIAVWNTFFALIQLAIGFGLVVRRTVRPALALSFVWALGVWVIGEGLGQLFTGTATALTGAPGSVLVYGLLGLMAWPRRRHSESSPAEVSGLASSAGAQGLGGLSTALAIWVGYWALAAVLFVLPDNRTTTSISSAIIGMGPGSPSWYERFLNHVGSALHSSGTETAWILAVVSLIIGFGPVLSRRPGWFLGLGALASFAFWFTAQGWLGGVFTGSGTDPNTGPLIIVMAVALVPTVVARAGARPPVAALVRWSAPATLGGVLAVGAALAISATYPVAALESSSAAMSGMHMGGSSSGSLSTSTSTSTCTTHHRGLAISGLDLHNTPLMIMSGHLGMDMNGADATAAAGLNTTTSNWHYTGTPLPNAEAQELLADGNNGPDDIHMAQSGCARSITSDQQIGSTTYVQATSAAVAHLANPFEAVAAGYVAASPTDYPVVYYVNPAIVAANAAAKRTLDPDHIDGLVYAKTPSGQEVLAAAMYILPSTVHTAPLPYGALVQWHQRTTVCGSVAHADGTTFDISGFPPCASGSGPEATPYVSMVWQVPVAGGPLAIQPPDIQIVESAVMGAGGS